MSALFGGVENFTPAFTGQQIANQTGAGAAQAFTSGMNAGTNRQGMDMKQKEMELDAEWLEKYMNALKDGMGRTGTSDGGYYHKRGGSFETGIL